MALFDLYAIGLPLFVPHLDNLPPYLFIRYRAQAILYYNRI